MAHWHSLGVAVGIAALVGCGNPTPDAPVSVAQYRIGRGRRVIPRG